MKVLYENKDIYVSTNKADQIIIEDSSNAEYVVLNKKEAVEVAKTILKYCGEQK